MRFLSTKELASSSPRFYSAREVCLLGLAPDGGLFLPETVPSLPREMTQNPERFPLRELAEAIVTPYFSPDLSSEDIAQIVSEVLSFPIPLIHLESQIYSLELFHGPTMAFKDFGALFLARTLSRLWQGENKDLTVLVATSGDTGGAVANGFAGVPGIQVVVLYPQGRVSDFQEKQMTTLGRNIRALEVQGTFDDCQRLVKDAFQDPTLKEKVQLTSANSINLARLLPQSFYYVEAIRQLRMTLPSSAHHPLVVSVPSGNLGNLCAGVLAEKMGFPVDQFLLATNKNRVAVDYLHRNSFEPRDSERTLSNAMDVGNPSNLHRLIALFQSHALLTEEISGSWWSEDDTRSAIRRVHEKTGYILDPHGAVGYLALEDYLATRPEYFGVFLETAHPAKFKEGVEETLGQKLAVPAVVQELERKTKQATLMPADYGALQDFLLAL